MVLSHHTMTNCHNILIFYVLTFIYLYCFVII